MSGMDIMIKALMPGVDPKQILDDIQSFGKTIAAFKEQMDRIEAKQDYIIASLQRDKVSPIGYLNGNSAVNYLEKKDD